jgi:hypothetical protein
MTYKEIMKFGARIAHWFYPNDAYRMSVGEFKYALTDDSWQGKTIRFGITLARLELL